MKTKALLIVLFFVYCSVNLFGQSVWTKKTDFPGSSRYSGIGLSVGKKGYYGLGQKQVKTSIYKVYTDFWEYDSEKNSWTQKSDFPGEGRLSANGFSVSGKIFVGLGYVIAPDGINTEYQEDLYEFDPSANKWSKKNDAHLEGSVDFIFNDTLCSVNLNKRVLKKYNPASDSWTASGTWSKETKSPNLTDIIGNKTVFSVNEKAFIITGEKKKGKYINQLWELNLRTITWNQKNDLAIPGSDSINVFKMEGKSYVLNGSNVFWEYNSDSDTWTEKKEISAPNKNFSPLFTIESGCYGFCNHEFFELAPAHKEASVKTNPIMTVSVDTIKRTSAPGAATSVALATSPITTTAIKTTISFNNVLFAFAKSKLRKEYLPELDKAVDLLKKEDLQVKFEIAGFTDSKGKAAYNKTLSKRRAEAVANYLVSKGINRSRMKVVGYGKEKPIAPNKNADGSDNPEGRAKNRRTEIVIIR